MARPRKKGPRTKSGRLVVMRDYGNDRVQEQRALFDAICIRQGKAVDQVHDGIGQLWALDFLDGHHLDPELMRDTARQYAERYWTRNADKAPKCSKNERSSHSTPSLQDTRADLIFERWLDSLPAYERAVLELSTVDYWFNGEGRVAPFIERLVSTELLRRGRIPRFIEMEASGDRDLLAALTRALFVLVDGSLPARWAA
jgi:hypothetical protein